MYLAGNPIILISLLFRNRRISFSRLPLLCIYMLKTISSFFYGMIELAFCTRKIENTVINDAPIFVLGHYRNGTTLLQKLLCSDNNFGSIRYQDGFFPISAFIFPGITRRIQQLMISVFGIKNIFFNNMTLKLNDPGEEDLYMISGSSRYSTAWGFVFPRAIMQYFNKWTIFDNNKEKEKWKRAYSYYLKRITLKNDHKPLILKSPPNIARIKVLLEMFPNARFVFISRNPYHVYYSMQNLWDNVIEKYFTLQKISVPERNKIILNLYSALMGQYMADRGLIPEGRHIEIRFEDLEMDPIGEVERIYSSLDIPDFEQSIDKIKNRLELEKGYSKNKYDYDEKTLNIISENWGEFIDEWGYRKPETMKHEVIN